MIISGIYNPGPLAPIAQIKENLTIWTVGQWHSYQIQFIEPLPASSQSTTDLVAVAGATQIAAYGQIAARLISFLQLSQGEFTQLRWECLDDVEGVLWEQSSVGRFVTRSLHSRVSLATRFMDPHLATSTFFILGQDKDAQIEAQNPNPVALPQARFRFTGFRYVLKPVDEATAKGIKEFRIPSTWVPAEGRGSS